jgi:hypothetical protein
MSNRKPIFIIKAKQSYSDAEKFSKLMNDSEISNDYHVLILDPICTYELISLEGNEKVTEKETSFYKRMINYVIRPNK